MTIAVETGSVVNGTLIILTWRTIFLTVQGCQEVPEPLSVASGITFSIAEIAVMTFFISPRTMMPSSSR